MLSPFAALRVNSAKHLVTPRDGSFASLRMTSEGPLAVPMRGRTALPCHAEPIRCAQGKLREASLRLSRGILRFAQDDKTLIVANGGTLVALPTDPSLRSG